MANQRALDKLRSFLNELFQFETQDLDFGVYKILHYKRKEIGNFVDHLLIDKVKEQLQTLSDDENRQLQAQLEKLEQDDIIKGWLKAEGEEKKTLEKFGTDKVKQYNELKTKVDQASVSIETENQIYNHLTLFFSRYYDKGDFISKRRFGKNEKYMVPYNGEETHFYWANHDQYYIKSSETFQQYKFKIPTHAGSMIVNFKLTDAQLEQGNVKAEETNFFVLSKKEADIEAQENTFFFEYRHLTDEEKTAFKNNNRQEQLNDLAYEKIKTEYGKKPELAELWKKNADDTPLLLKKLRHYTRKNNYDFFIHKDLKGFLTRELDFYIKSEMIDVDDLYISDTDEHVDRLKHRLKSIKVFKAIAETIIDFVSQIEDFQKKLWEKKKFVLNTEWVITIDRLVEYIGEEAAKPILDKVIKNKKQVDEWKALFCEGIFNDWDNIKIIDLTQLHKQQQKQLDFSQNKLAIKEWLKLPIDTAHFSMEFKLHLLNELSTSIKLEKKVDGMLINTDNFHGLQTSKDKFYKRIDGLYLDPPYNTNATIIIYKNGFKDSSWISMMENRTNQIDDLLKENGIFCITIDDYEYNNLYNLLKILNSKRALRTSIIEYNFRGRVKSNFAITHEYGLWGITEDKDLITKLRKRADDIKRNLRRTGSGSRRFESPTMFYGIEVDNESLEIINVYDALEKNEPIPTHTNEKTTIVWPIDDDGVERRWYYGIDRVRLEKNDTVYAKIISGKIQIHYIKEGKEVRRKAVWTNKLYDASTYGSELINDLFGISELKQFDFPKSIYAVKESLEAMTYNRNAWYMDYFGGSGSTFHATQLMNIEDKGKRKCIMMEQGQYFYSVIIPRIKKIAFTTRWNKGKPNLSNTTGLGVFFKYQRLEQYEEALENIAFTAPEDAKQKALAFDQYIPKYMLEFETKDSQTLVNTVAMKDPWDYKLKVWDGFTYDTEQAVDLVETFNYLIGLHMQQCITKEINGYKYQFILGHNNANKQLAVVWRSVKDWTLEDYKADAKVLENELKTFSFDQLYINDQATLPETMSYQPIEEIFKNKMMVSS
jgi:adenine-specific DNA-methyltransferase